MTKKHATKKVAGQSEGRSRLRSKVAGKALTASSARAKAKEAAEVDTEKDQFLASLREHNQVIEADRADIPLPPGVTYVLIRKDGDQEPQLVERRKSFF